MACMTVNQDEKKIEWKFNRSITRVSLPERSLKNGGNPIQKPMSCTRWQHA